MYSFFVRKFLKSNISDGEVIDEYKSLITDVKANENICSTLNRPVREVGNGTKSICGPSVGLSGQLDSSKLGTYSVECLRLHYGPTELLNKVIKTSPDIYDAAKNGYFGFVQFYLEDHPVDKFQHVDDMKLLYLASVGGNVDLLKYLIDKKNISQFGTTSYNGIPLLHVATKAGKLEAVRYFIETMKNDIDMRDFDGDTPAHIASGVSLTILKYLVEKGADLTVKNHDEEGLLHASAYGGNLETAKFLVEEKHWNLEVKNKYRETPLYIAVRRNSLPLVKYLAGERKANLDVKNYSGKNLLHQAAFAKNLDLMKYLVDNLKMVSRIEEKELTGGTVAFEAVEYADLPILKYLIDEKNANSSITNKKGYNLLHLAASKNEFAIVKYLVEEKSFDVKAKTSAGETVYDLAVKRGADLKVKVFLQRKICSDQDVDNESVISRDAKCNSY